MCVSVWRVYMPNIPTDWHVSFGVLCASVWKVCMPSSKTNWHVSVMQCVCQFGWSACHIGKSVCRTVPNKPACVCDTVCISVSGESVCWTVPKKKLTCLSDSKCMCCVFQSGKCVHQVPSVWQDCPENWCVPTVGLQVSGRVLRLRWCHCHAVLHCCPCALHLLWWPLPQKHPHHRRGEDQGGVSVNFVI